jgi:hypothetical protein
MNDATLFSRTDADRILRRAAEIEGSDDPRRLTLAELRVIADEAGFTLEAVERAIAEARESEADDAPRLPVRSTGFFVARVSAIRHVPVGITSEQLLRAVRLFQPYRDGAAQVKLEDREIAWRDRKGLRFNVLSVGGVTEIRVSVAKPLLRRGRWMGWVRAAADRLEALVELVAREG